MTPFFLTHVRVLEDAHDVDIGGSQQISDHDRLVAEQQLSQHICP